MRIGVVGAAGKIGQLRIKSIANNSKTSLAAVLDVTQEVAEGSSPGTPGFSELEAFLETEMDAVIVSTPPKVHEEACVAALERGLDVLVEKPMASSLESCRRMTAAAEKAGRTLATGFNMRYYPAFAFVKDTIDAGKIGNLDHVRAFGGHDGLAHFNAEWQYRVPETGGGVMWDIGIHVTDMVHHLLGDITSVYGVATEHVWKLPGSEDNAIVVMKNSSGIPATYHATWNEWKGYQFVIEAYGDLGMVRGAYAPMHNLLLTQSKPGGPTTRTVKRYWDVAVREKLKSWKSTALLSFDEELDDFIKLAEGKGGLRIANGYAGMRAIEIADAVYRSTETNEAVILPGLPHSAS